MKINEKILNRECDKTLARIHSTWREDVVTLRMWHAKQVEKGGESIDFNTILSILLVDGFIKDIEQSGVYYTITATGIAFMATSSYETKGKAESRSKRASSKDNWYKINFELIGVFKFIATIVSGIVIGYVIAILTKSR